MILVRVPAEKLKEQDAYSYYAGSDKSNKAQWNRDYKQRKAVFVNPGKCYRSGITYNQGLGRYLWCQMRASLKTSPVVCCPGLTAPVARLFPTMYSHPSSENIISLS